MRISNTRNIFCVAWLLSALVPAQVIAASATTEPLGSVNGCPNTDTDDYASYIAGDWQTPVPGQLQKVIIASDPQAFRVVISQDPLDEAIDETKWKSMLNENYMASLRIQRQGDAYVPLIINGDITEFGHSKERSAVQERFKMAPSSKPGPLILPGLGNHDYDQNVGDCANNGCARDAVCDHIAWVQTIQNKSRGVNFDYRFTSGGGTPSQHTGSLSYSVDVGKLHIVQLNLEPTYTRQFEGGTLDSRIYFNIENAMNWLSADLRDAKRRGQVSIVNLHKRTNWQNPQVRTGAFEALLEETGVIAVFAGHYHTQIGRWTTIGKVPVFQTGALLNRSYLALYFDWHENILHVKNVVDSVDAGESFVRFGPAPPPPAGSLHVELFMKPSYSGEACSLYVLPGAERTRIYSSKCAQHANNTNMSMKVRGYVPSMGQLCLAGTGTHRCYGGDYQGDFSIPQFLIKNPLPEGLKRSGWGAAAAGFYDISLGL